MTAIRRKSLSFNLEPTFRCNLGCEMCPRFSSQDPFLDMTLDTYARIHEAMGYAHTVDFTGWGEPLLHSRIYEMVAMAREKGCLTSMTSNGTALNERNSLALIDAGMNRLTVSVDGMRPETFDKIRIGASFEKITVNLRRLADWAERRGDLELAVAFTLQEENAGDLELVVPWLRRVGARKLHLKQLNVVSNRDDWSRSFLKYRLAPTTDGNGGLGGIESRMAALRDEARAAGIEVLVHSELPMTAVMKGRHCLATPLESVYFSYEGRVSPCCHFGHHVSRYFEGRQYAPSALFFGDIRTQDFDEVWLDPAFQAFRHGFETGHYPAACRTCYLLYGK